MGTTQIYLDEEAPFLVTVEELSRFDNTITTTTRRVYAANEDIAVLRALGRFPLHAITRPVGVRAA